MNSIGEGKVPIFQKILHLFSFFLDFKSFLHHPTIIIRKVYDVISITIKCYNKTHSTEYIELGWI